MSDSTWGRAPRAGDGPGRRRPTVHPLDKAFDEPAVDLSALRTPADAHHGARWEALAARIERAAAPELARRARVHAGGHRADASDSVVRDLVPLLARALRPALAAAAVAAVVAGAAVSGAGGGAAGGRTTDSTADEWPAAQLATEAQVAQALRVGDAEAAWLAEGTPTRAALAHAVGLDTAADDAAEARP